jgi:hypothetical protein
MGILFASIRAINPYFRITDSVSVELLIDPRRVPSAAVTRTNAQMLAYLVHAAVASLALVDGEARRHREQTFERGKVRHEEEPGRLKSCHPTTRYRP